MLLELDWHGFPNERCNGLLGTRSLLFFGEPVPLLDPMPVARLEIAHEDALVLGT